MNIIREKLVIISYGSFGDVLDYPKILESLSGDLECIFFGIGAKNSQNVNVKIVITHLRKFFKRIFFIISGIKFIKKNNPEYKIVSYFPGCFLLGLFLSKAVLDIRTGYISSSSFINFIMNLILRIESLFFYRVFIISDGLRIKLRIKKSKSLIVPVGCDSPNPIKDSLESNSKNNYIYLYVGTFFNRNISKMISSYCKFIANRNYKFSSLIPKFLIIGALNDAEIRKYSDMVNQLNCSKFIEIIGRIPHQDLKPYFEKADSGIAYIPQIDCYEYQPPTKILEYMSYGLPTLATSTFANKDLLEAGTGIIKDDSINDFAKGFEFLYENKTLFKKDIIMQKAILYSWERLAKGTIFPFLKSIR